MKKDFFTAIRWTAASVICCTGFTALAQTPDSLQSAKIREIMVTATRAPKPLTDIGRSVTIIDSDKFQNSVFNNVGELLAQQEGIYVVGAGQNPGMNQSLFMRGAASNQTVILIDGIRVTDPSGVNNALDLTELSLSNIDRIEIVRGSHSTLYGSSAIGGVVNIFTKKGQTPGLQGQANLHAGKFGAGTFLANQSLDLNYTFAKGFYAQAQINSQQIKGLDATVDTLHQGNRDQDDFSRLDLGGKIGYRSSRWEVYAGIKNTDYQTDIDKGAYSDDDNATTDFSRNLFTYGASYRFNPRFSLSYTGGHSAMRREVVDDSSYTEGQGFDHTFVRSTGEGLMATNEVQGNFTSSGVKAVLGLGRYRETMNATSYYFTNGQFGKFEFSTDLGSLDLRANTHFAFAHVDLNGVLLSESLQGLSLALGVRANKHTNFGSFTTYEINPAYKFKFGTLLYASVSTGFNAPSLYQLYTPGEDFTSGISRGNAGLAPETSQSREIGIKHSFRQATFGVSVFRTRVQNTIEYVYLWARENPTFDDYRGDTYLNLSRQDSRGLEVTADIRAGKKLRISGNISLVSGELKATPEDINTQKTKGNKVQLYNSGAFVNKQVTATGLTRRPNTANLSLTFMPVPAWLFRLDGRYAGNRNDVFYDYLRGPYGALGTRQVGDYTLADLSTRYTINRYLTAGLKVENLLNNRYSEISGYTTRGRGLYASLSFRL